MLKHVDHSFDLKLGDAICGIARVEIGTKIVFEQNVMGIALDGFTKDMFISLVLEEIDYGLLKGSFVEEEHGL